VGRLSALWKASPRKVLVAMGGLIATAAVVMGSGANFNSTSANPSNVFSAGTIAHSNSKAGAAILTASNIVPKATETGTVDIRNTGTATGTFIVTHTNPIDTPASPGLSKTLTLTVQDLGDPTCSSGCAPAVQVYTGTISAMPASIALATYAPGATHRYQFTVAFPDGGSGGADNAYQNAATSIEYDWESTSSDRTTATTANTPAATVFTGSAAVRGGNLITTYPSGQVDMITGTGERRVLTGDPTASDYTITSNATLLSGAGYGVYVRASVDAATKLTGYCVQLDHGYSGGQIVVREVQSDFELSTPIANVPAPPGMVWYGVSHVFVVTVKGNTLNVALDGSQVINVPDLAAASATAVKSSWGVTMNITPPTAGGYGLRAWSDGLVSLQQMTTGSAG
jgi:spore coat-associated protein N